MRALVADQPMIQPISTHALRAYRSAEGTLCQGVIEPVIELMACNVARNHEPGMLSFREVTRADDWHQVREFRLQQYARLLPYMLEEFDSTGADHFDGHSCVFAAWLGERVIATIRLTPYPFESCKHVSGERLAAALGDDWQTEYLEWTRLVIDPSAPVRDITPAIITYAGLKTMTTTPYRKYFGYASTVVQRLFRRFELQTDSQTFQIPSRGSHSYVLLKGDFMKDFERLLQAWKTGAPGSSGLRVAPARSGEQPAAAHEAPSELCL